MRSRGQSFQELFDTMRSSLKPNLLPLRLGAGMLVVIGLILLGCMFWISSWPREGSGSEAAFVTESLPGYRFKPEILPRLGRSAEERPDLASRC
jgi:hypothetical protein